ncbi:hypothetical protein K3495_g12666 [Podosphaera aphanis]|nr:hypothetical protein K3495_g12666 [Podosphaera aphanis]
MDPPPEDYPPFVRKHDASEYEWMTMAGTCLAFARKHHASDYNNKEPEDIVQKSVTTSHDLPPQQTTNEFEIPQGDNQNEKDSFKELVYSQHADIRESADIEEPNVPSTEDEEPTAIVNAEVEFILE